MPNNKPHLFDVREGPTGKGVFAGKSFKRGDFLMNYSGTITHLNQLPEPYVIEDDHYLQIDEMLYLGPSGKADDYVNHSCKPNAGIKYDTGVDTVTLYAIRSIKKGEEICFDYSTYIGKDDDFLFPCLCKSSNCRKTIKAFVTLPKNIQQKYIRLGIVAPFILHEL